MSTGERSIKCNYHVNTFQGTEEFKSKLGGNWELCCWCRLLATVGCSSIKFEKSAVNIEIYYRMNQRMNRTIINLHAVIENP